MENFPNFPNFTFSRQIARFSSAKILWPFLVIDHKFWIFPLFSLFQYISPLIIIVPLLYFYKFPLFLKNSRLFTYFVCISFPLLWPWCIYASHNARTGRPCRKAEEERVVNEKVGLWTAVVGRRAEMIEEFYRWLIITALFSILFV